MSPTDLLPDRGAEGEEVEVHLCGLVLPARKSRRCPPLVALPSDTMMSEIQNEGFDIPKLGQDLI